MAKKVVQLKGVGGGVGTIMMGVGGSELGGRVTQKQQINPPATPGRQIGPGLLELHGIGCPAGTHVLRFIVAVALHAAMIARL